VEGEDGLARGGVVRRRARYFVFALAGTASLAPELVWEQLSVRIGTGTGTGMMRRLVVEKGARKISCVELDRLGPELARSLGSDLGTGSVVAEREHQVPFFRVYNCCERRDRFNFLHGDEIKA
jgi:hypothetical protein